jgi:CII-binding regulator of phage lambda lysogenization HflD
MAKSKMKPADAVKVLANEVSQTKQVIQQITQDLMQTRAFLQEVARVLESYIAFEGKQDKFTEYMKELGAKAKAAAEKEAQANDNRSNESTDGSDTIENKIDEGVGAEGVRA